MIELELPIYCNITKRKQALMSLNWYRNAHYQQSNKIKRYYNELIKSKLGHAKTCLKGKIQVSYRLYYKNSASDLNNVIAVIDKYLLDALQELNYIENDNVKNYVKCVSEVAGQDKDNPRLEVIVDVK